MTRHRRKKLAAFLAIALSGGTVFGTCEMRIHDSIINGTQQFILGLFNPSNITVAQ
ncbi:MAG: hypothetical protein H6816_01875 [Phycisphaerales bacterium]|nr:hypothetical protein [Phycisphaerales bacterium]